MTLLSIRSLGRAPARCSGGHGFDSCRGMRFFCPTLVSCWLFQFSHFITGLKIAIFIYLNVFFFVLYRSAYIRGLRNGVGEIYSRNFGENLLNLNKRELGELKYGFNRTVTRTGRKVIKHHVLLWQNYAFHPEWERTLPLFQKCKITPLSRERDVSNRLSFLTSLLLQTIVQTVNARTKLRVSIFRQVTAVIVNLVILELTAKQVMTDH